AFDAHRLGRAVVPQPGGPAAHRAVAFAHLGRRLAQRQANPPAVAATPMPGRFLAHRRTSSTQAGTSSLAGPSRVSPNQAEPWLRSRLSSSVAAPLRLASCTKPAAG